MQKLNKYAIYGASLTISMCFLEAIPLSETTRQIPRHMVVRFILDLLPEFKSIFLILPAMIFLGIALLPIKTENTKWIYPWLLSNLITFTLIASATRHTEYGHYGPVWLILILPALGLILWVDNNDYTYSLFISSVFWDLFAAIKGPLVGWYSVPEPYWSAVPFYVSILVDATLIVFLLALWLRGYDLNRTIKHFLGVKNIGV